MLVIISDLHLTDGTSGKTISDGAFRVFRQRLRDLAYDASKRADGTYKPIREMDILLLGDIFDLIRSTKWLEKGESGSARPWDNACHSPAFTERVRVITRAVLEKNAASCAILKALTRDDKITGESITLPPPTRSGGVDKVGREPDAPGRLPVKVRLHYLIGNHDWFLHLPGAAYDQIRQDVVSALGLSNDPGEPFAHEPSGAIKKICRRHNVCARHGDIFDGFNFEAGPGRAASSLGDAIVVELLNRFPGAVARAMQDKLPAAARQGLAELDNVRPSLIVPVWIDGLLHRTCQDKGIRDEVKAIWDNLSDEFLSLPFVRERDTWKPVDDIDKLEAALKFAQGVSFGAASRIVNFVRETFWDGAISYHEKALKEEDFLNGRAQFIIYGHTHHQEIVPLDVSRPGGRLFDQMYLNSGTWRRVHTIAAANPDDKEFVDYNVMTYLAFFNDGERRGRPFETWSGALSA